MVALCVITSTSGALGAWRAPVEAREGIVASAHPEATTAGQSMLAAGGNAVDAAVAVSFALSVVEPWSSGIGGGAFMVLHLDGQTTTWDMREMAPAAAHRDLFVKDGKVVKGLSTRSALASGIPGLVRGLARVHAKHGRLPLPVVMAPAIRLAREGFHVSQRFREQVLIGVDHMNPAARRIFLGPDGEARAVGSLIVQRDKARTLEAIASSGGEDFYVGDVARRLVDSVRSQGGIWTLKDMASYRPVERPAVRGRYRGWLGQA